MAHEINDDPTTAPKDGTVITVQLPDGKANKARWNTTTREWEALDSRDNQWRRMGFLLGSNNFVSWWRD